MLGHVVARGTDHPAVLGNLMEAIFIGEVLFAYAAIPVLAVARRRTGSSVSGSVLQIVGMIGGGNRSLIPTDRFLKMMSVNCCFKGCLFIAPFYAVGSLFCQKAYLFSGSCFGSFAGCAVESNDDRITRPVTGRYAPRRIVVIPGVAGGGSAVTNPAVCCNLGCSRSVAEVLTAHRAGPVRSVARRGAGRRSGRMLGQVVTGRDCLLCTAHFRIADRAIHNGVIATCLSAGGRNYVLLDRLCIRVRIVLGEIEIFPGSVFIPVIISITVRSKIDNIGASGVNNIVIICATNIPLSVTTLGFDMITSS